MGNSNDNIVKDTEIGQLSVEWDVRRLGELADKPQYGLTASAIDAPVGPQFLRITDIQDGGVNWATVPYCDSLDGDFEKCRLRNGDLVVARIGATTGKSYLITDPPKAVFASYLIRIRTKDGLLPEFLHQFANSAEYWRQINEAKGGRLKQGVNIPNLQNLRIPLPPLAEQRAIAQVLRTVQRAKEATEKVLAATKQLKQSLLRHLFTYGPVPFDQADQVELKETEIGPMPEHWGVSPLRAICRLASGGTPSKQRPDFWRGSIPWVSPKDMKSPRLWDAEDHISQQGLEDGSRLVPAGALFIVVRGMILAKEVPLALAMTPMAFNQDMKAILPNDRVLSSEYLLYALIRHRDVLLPEIGTSAHGTRRISTSAVENFPIPLPPRREQEIISAALATVDRKAGKETIRNHVFTTLFKSLLHHLMTGKVRVHDLGLALNAQEGLP